MTKARTKAEWIQKLTDVGIPYPAARSIFEDELYFEPASLAKRKKEAEILRMVGERFVEWLSWKPEEFFPFPQTVEDFAKRVATYRKAYVYLGLWRWIQQSQQQAEREKHYVVSWEIDIWDRTPEGAAAKALEIQRDQSSIATQFKVWDGENHTVVDLHS